jgi:hypothetical protein
MIYSLDLRTALMTTALFLLAVHAFALVRADWVKALLPKFPRSRVAGFFLLVLAAAWFWGLVYTIDLGEFTEWRRRILVGVPVAAGLALFFVEEFLAVRALGMLALLAAEPLLEAAWMRPESGRLLLVVLAYAWVILGMFWVGSPYLLRDQIAWITQRESRWKAAIFGGLFYGAALLVVSLTLHH